MSLSAFFAERRRGRENADLTIKQAVGSRKMRRCFLSLCLRAQRQKLAAAAVFTSKTKIYPRHCGGTFLPRCMLVDLKTETYPRRFGGVLDICPQARKGKKISASRRRGLGVCTWILRQKFIPAAAYLFAGPQRRKSVGAVFRRGFKRAVLRAVIVICTAAADLFGSVCARRVGRHVFCPNPGKFDTG